VTNLRAIAVGATILAAGLHPGPAAAADVPLPDDIRIAEPGPAVPEAFRRFLGTWAGKWSDKLDTVVVVEKVEASGQATVVYAWGDYAPWKVTRDWARWKATITGGRMTLERFPNDAVASFVFRDDGNLGGTYAMQRYVHYGTFRPGKPD